MPHQQTARGPGTFASNLGYLLADTHTLMGCDPKLSSCDSIGFVRPVSLKKKFASARGLVLRFILWIKLSDLSLM